MQVSDLGNGAVVVGLPAGLTGVYDPGPKIFTISGTPTQSGTFNYTVTATGPCVNTSLSGTIIVFPLVSGTITGAPNNQICKGQGTSLNIDLTGTPNFTGVFDIAVISGVGSPSTLLFNANVAGASAVTIPPGKLSK